MSVTSTGPSDPPAIAVVLACAGCGTIVTMGHPFTPRCPARRPDDDVDHVLHRVFDLDRLPAPSDPDPNPFVRYRTLFYGYHAARAAGWPDGRYVDLVRALDDAVAEVDGRGFRVTPLLDAPKLARAAGLGRGGRVWAKDETGNVAGSHKGRHLFATMLELRVAEALGAADPSRPLAIASCGNAALAAGVVARAAGRELRVFVPSDADAVVLEQLRTLGADIVVCERQPGEWGDPSYLRLQEALARGAVPFTCQGPDNAFAIEGGSTLAWEIADELRRTGRRLDRIVIQVGGGAFASSVALGMSEAAELRVIEAPPRLDTVQTAGAWPLARAFERLLGETNGVPGVPVHPVRVRELLHHAAAHRSGYMWPWETAPHSVAHGILDDETYDWLAVTRAMLETGGRAVVVGEDGLTAANALARDATGVDADETGTAGVAGLFELARTGALEAGEQVAVVLSGVRRAPPPERAQPHTASSRSDTPSERSTP